MVLMSEREDQKSQCRMLRVVNSQVTVGVVYIVDGVWKPGSPYQRHWILQRWGYLTRVLGTIVRASATAVLASGSRAVSLAPNSWSFIGSIFGLLRGLKKKKTYLWLTLPRFRFYWYGMEPKLAYNLKPLVVILRRRQSWRPLDFQMFYGQNSEKAYV